MTTAQNTAATNRYRPSLDPVVNRTARLALAWSGIACVVVFFIGFVPFAQFIPFPSPATPAAEVASNIADNAIGIRIGVNFMLIGFALFATFVCGVALELRRTDGNHPALTFAQLVCGGASTASAVAAVAGLGRPTLPRIPSAAT